jgi:hypothetical protein
MFYITLTDNTKIETTLIMRLGSKLWVWDLYTNSTISINFEEIKEISI